MTTPASGPSANPQQEAERQAVAALLDAQAQPGPGWEALRTRAPQLVQESDFNDRRLAAVFRAWLALTERGAPAGVLQVSAELAALNINHIGLPELQLLLQEATPSTSAGALDALQRVRASASDRRLQRNVGRALISKEPEERVRLLREALAEAEIPVDGGQRRTSRALAESMSSIRAEAAPMVLPSSLASLNKLLGGGYQSHSTVVLNGGTKHGKSALALQEARHMAEAGVPTLVVSLEMREREIWSRLAAQRLQASHQEVNRSYWQGENHAQLLEALAGPVANLRVSEFTREMTLQSIFAEVRRVADETGRRPFVVIDYLQRILSRLEQPGQDRRALCGRLSDELAQATRTLGATFLVLSAIPRTMYGDRTEEMDDDELNAAAKESGEIEYDAGAVMFLRKQERADDGRYHAQLRLTATRYSSGSDGQSLPLIFDGAHNRFEPADGNHLHELDRKILEELLLNPGSPQQKLGTSLNTRTQLISRSVQRLARLNLVHGRPPRLTVLGQAKAQRYASSPTP